MRERLRVWMDSDAGGDDWDGRCHIGVYVCVSVMVLVVGSLDWDPAMSKSDNSLDELQQPIGTSRPFVLPSATRQHSTDLVQFVVLQRLKTTSR